MKPIADSALDRALPTRFHAGVRLRLLLSVSLVAIVMLGGAAASIVGLDHLREGYQLLTNTELPRLVDASALARQSESIVASAPGLVISRDQFTRTTASDRIADQVRFLDELLLQFKGGESDSRTTALLEETKQNLLENLRRIDSMVGRRIEFDARSESIVHDIVGLTGRRAAFETRALANLTQSGARETTDLIRWSGETQNALSLMLAAYGAERSASIGAFQKQAGDAIERAEQLAKRIRLVGDDDAALQALNGEIRDRVSGNNNVFTARNEVLGLERSVAGLLARNKVISDQFGNAVSGVFETIRDDLDEKTASYRDFLSIFQRTLIIVTIVGLVLVLLAFVYLSRSIIRRVVALRDSMLAHAGGNTAPIDTAGRDEISDMARALGFFVTAIRRREEALTGAKEQAETALRELRRAQQSLIQAEKMASLGQLTAGVAHEIKNPLNFVNNFASLSVELVAELKAELDPDVPRVPQGAREALDQTLSTLAGNLAKITEHGRRADGIVNSMLLHSRGGSGEHRPTDLNALLEEALNLAYHGARAQDKSFNISFERNLDPAVGRVDIVPQDITRVFLNLFSNSFYAVRRRQKAAGATFKPLLVLATSAMGPEVEVRVRDNGVGMTKDVLERLFTPFFTTKPTGEGTGLGLSLSYDSVVHQHGGRILATSEPDEYTEFIVRLPRKIRTTAPIAAAGAPT
ncbi:HAMP domain-containing protein [Rhizobiales bacterium GAS113]|nr:HAMP domain-containing protein [Rhizobiales bacterium GAS113]